MNDMEPLGKPRGTVRAYLAIMIVTAFILAHIFAVAVFLGVPGVGLDEPNTEAAIAILAAMGIETANVTAFYFVTRPQ